MGIWVFQDKQLMRHESGGSSKGGAHTSPSESSGSDLLRDNVADIVADIARHKRSLRFRSGPAIFRRTGWILVWPPLARDLLFTMISQSIPTKEKKKVICPPLPIETDGTCSSPGESRPRACFSLFFALVSFLGLPHASMSC